MKLYFDRIEIGPFKAYRTPQVLDLKDMGRGLWFVEGHNLVQPHLGSNGAAKSTIWDCLSWVLYGKTIKGKGNPAVKTWRSKDAPEGKVWLNVDGVDHVVHRKGVTNGLWLDAKGVVQDEIDRLVGIAHANFLHTLVLGQGRDLFFDLPPGKKMEVLSETLKLDRWDDRIAKARRKTAELDTTLIRLDADVRSCGREIDSTDDRLRDLEKQAREWDEDRQSDEDVFKARIKELQGHLKFQQDRLDKADLAYDSAETELRAVQRKVDDNAERARTAITERANATAKFDAATEHERTCKRALDGALKGDTCPVCKQPLDKHAQQDLDIELNDALRAAEDDTDKARKLMYAAIDADEAFKSAERALTADLRHFREKSNDAIDERTRAQSEVNGLKADIEAIEHSMGKAPPPNPYTAMVSQMRKDLRALKAREEDLLDAIKGRTWERDTYKYWIDGFKQVRLYLIEDMLIELEGVTQTLLASVGLDDWRIEYSIEKETKKGTTLSGINVYIFHPQNDDAVEWDSFSGGELQRLRLVGAVALSEVLLERAGVRCDLLVLDEPTRHLSPEGVRDTVDLLADLGRDRQVLYVDHQAVEGRRFAGVVTVTHDRDGARLAVAA